MELGYNEYSFTTNSLTHKMKCSRDSKTISNPTLFTTHLSCGCELLIDSTLLSASSSTCTENTMVTYHYPANYQFLKMFNFKDFELKHNDPRPEVIKPKNIPNFDKMKLYIDGLQDLNTEQRENGISLNKIATAYTEDRSTFRKAESSYIYKYMPVLESQEFSGWFRIISIISQILIWIIVLVLLKESGILTKIVTFCIPFKVADTYEIFTIPPTSKKSGPIETNTFLVNKIQTEILLIICTILSIVCLIYMISKLWSRFNLPCMKVCLDMKRYLTKEYETLDTQIILKLTAPDTILYLNLIQLPYSWDTLKFTAVPYTQRISVRPTHRGIYLHIIWNTPLKCQSTCKGPVIMKECYDLPRQIGLSIFESKIAKRFLSHNLCDQSIQLIVKDNMTPTSIKSKTLRIWTMSPINPETVVKQPETGSRSTNHESRVIFTNSKEGRVSISTPLLHDPMEKTHTHTMHPNGSESKACTKNELYPTLPQE